MTIATGDVIRISAIMKREALDDVVNVYHVKPVSIGAETQQALRDDLTAYMEDIYDGMISVIHDSITFDIIELFNVTDGTPEPAEPWPVLTVGSATTDPLPDGVAALSLGRTGVSKVVGKKFWPITTEGKLTDGLIVSGSVTIYAAAAATWIAPFTGASGVTWDPGVWSRALALFRPFTETTTTNVPAYQRRRKRGVGS